MHSKNKKRTKMTPWSLKETKSLPQHPLSTPGPYPANNLEHKPSGNPRTPSSKIFPLSQGPRVSDLKKTPIGRCTTRLRRHMCPVSGCRNFGGRGYARSTFVNHLNTHSRILLTNEIERTRALQAATSFGILTCCGLCGKLNSSASGRSVCKKCNKQSRNLTVVKENLPQATRSLLTAKIRVPIRPN